MNKHAKTFHVNDDDELFLWYDWPMRSVSSLDHCQRCAELELKLC